jgi:hypothetical protein
VFGAAAAADGVGHTPEFAADHAVTTAELVVFAQ